MRQSPDPPGPPAQLAGLRSRSDALRHAAALPGAELRPVLDAALAELDAAIETLKAADGAAGEDAGNDASDSLHAERRMLHAVFLQTPVPLFLLGLDGTVRRVNGAAGDLLGAGPGYATGKPLMAFIALPSRAAVQTQLAAVVRTGETRHVRCGLLAAAGTADCVLTVRPVSVRGDSGQLIVAADVRGLVPPGARLAGARRPEPARPEPPQRGAAQDAPPAGVVEAMTRRLDLVTGVTRILLENVTHSESVTLQRCARLLAREFAAWVLVDTERGQRLERQVVIGPQDQQSEELARLVTAVGPQPGTAPRQVYESGNSLLAAHPENAGILGEDPDGVPLLMLAGATSVLCVPLSDGAQSYGVLTLARQTGQGQFSMADIGLVEELGEQIALAITVDRIFRRHTEVADALQASLLPRELRQIPGAEIAAAHLAARGSHEVGGDFYDVYPAKAGWGIAIGDVCGKGQDAAAVAAAARHAIRVLAHWEADPATVLRGANAIMLAEDFGGRFVTADASYLQWRGGSLHVVLGSAGHPRPVLIRPDGRTVVMPGGGLPLGIFSDAEPATHELDLASGDMLFFFTDGVTSACGPDLSYFEDRLTDELAALAGEPAAVVVSRMQELVLEFCGGDLRDDLTIVVVRAGTPPDA